MNLKLPATDRLVCQDLGEGDGQTISEEPLTSLALHVKSCDGEGGIEKFTQSFWKTAVEDAGKSADTIILKEVQKSREMLPRFNKWLDSPNFNSILSSSI